MARTKKETVESDGKDLATDLIHRKLTGVFTTVSIQIPWHLYDDHLDELERELYDNWNVDIDRADLSIRPEVVAAFEQQCHDYIHDVDWYDLRDHDGLKTKDVFKDEIAAQKLIDEAERAERERAMQEALEKAAAEKAAKETTITISTRHYAKAMKLLKAASLIK